MSPMETTMGFLLLRILSISSAISWVAPVEPPGLLMRRRIDFACGSSRAAWSWRMISSDDAPEEPLSIDSVSCPP